MGCRSKGKKSCQTKMTKSQIDVIKFFKDFGINILKHKTIYGVMVCAANPEYDTDDVKLVGFISVPLNGIQYSEILVDRVTHDSWAVVGDNTVIVNKSFNLEEVGDEFAILDRCNVLGQLQEAVDEGLCQFSKEFDIVYLEKVKADFEDVSDDINER